MIKYIALTASTALAFSQTPPPGQTGEPPPWQWSWEKVQSVVGKVRAGKDLTPKTWPGNNRVAVALSFDLDRKSTRLNSSHTEIYTLSLHDALPIWEKVQSVVGKVRAGKDLTPKTWPGNNRVAVALSFD